MRIVGGEWRGRPLRAPGGRATRPTSDKVREAMFGVILALPETTSVASRVSGVGAGGRDEGGGPLAGHVVLDLFAGSGGLGLEALSRGARSCTFVESAPAARSALRANLDRLGVPVRRRVGPLGSASRSGARDASDGGDAAAAPFAVVLAADVRRALAADARGEARYTLVFADPPYDLYEVVRPDLARMLGRVLAPGAILVVESAAQTPAGLPWTVLREKRYGDTRVTVLVAGGAQPEEGTAADDDRLLS